MPPPMISSHLCERREDLDRAARLAQEAAEFALTAGIVRYTRERHVVHLPISLLPWSADRAFVEETQALTPLFNELYHRVAQDRDFLEECLGEARRVDPFIARLFGALADQPAGKPCLYMNRNDCMPSIAQGRFQPKQVEMNLIASALGEASARTYQMHRFLYRETPLASRIVENTAGEDLTWALAEGHSRLADQAGAVLFLVPPGEVNIFDQRALEIRLALKYGVPVARSTLEELGGSGRIKDGHLYLGHRKIAIAYFRGGYAPHHYTNDDAWKARKLIEESDCVSVPAVATQLANTKMVQLFLAQRSNLERFVSPEKAARLLAANVGFAHLDEEIEWRGQRGLAREIAAEHSEDWVLKPHREGGGNNFFGPDLVERLGSIAPSERKAFILMEMIEQPIERAVRLVEFEPIESDCVTELGFFGICLYLDPRDDKPLFNRTAGYLQRTKDVHNKEGLVLGGFSFIDSSMTGAQAPRPPVPVSE